MKTSNKILLSAMILIILVVIGMIIYISRGISAEVIQGSGNVIEVERRIEDDFDRIRVRNSIVLYITQGTESQIRIEADDNLTELIHTGVEQGELRISLTESVARDATLKVHVQTPQLTALHISGGARAYTEQPVTGESFSHTVQAGAKSELHIVYDKLDLKMRAGAVSRIYGSVGSLSATTVAGSMLHANELVAEHAKIRSNTGAINRLHVTETLTGQLRQGSIIQYNGNPDTSGLEIRSGAHIEIIDSNK